MLDSRAFLLGFLCASAVMVGVAWVGGYEFDRRGPDVAFGLMMSLIVSFAFGCFAAGYASLSNGKP